MVSPSASIAPGTEVAVEIHDLVPELAERLERGETVTLLHHGRRLATASPLTEERRRKAALAFQELIEMGDQIRREGRGFTAEELRQFRDEGRP